MILNGLCSGCARVVFGALPIQKHSESKVTPIYSGERLESPRIHYIIVMFLPRAQPGHNQDAI